MPVADRNPNRKPPPAQTGLSRPKKFVFAVVALLIAFGGTELLLAVIGIRPLLATDDPYVGFASKIPLFVKVRDASGNESYRTATNKLDFFNDQNFPVEKGPNEYRIFCMGGSTTYGRPYSDSTSFVGWLRRFLRAADPTRDWVVVNAGGVSYASYRVAALMEELVRYHPDLFIVYSGHNEFLERRTYSGIIREHPLVTATNLVVYQSRTASLLRSAIHRVWQTPGEAARTRYQMTGEVAPLLDSSAGLNLYHRDDDVRRQILDHYRFNLGRMVALARGVGAELIFVKPACNLKDFSPFKSEQRSGLTATERTACNESLASGEEALDRSEFSAARDALQQALRLDDRFAQTHFLMGRALLNLRDVEGARRDFVRAVEEDVCPLRMLPGMGTVISDIAHEWDVPLIDYSARLERDAAQRFGLDILGKEYFLDHVHPTIEAHRLLGALLLDQLSKGGIAHPTPDWNDDRMNRIAKEVENAIDESTHAKARGTLARVLNWAGKYEEADRLAASAAEALAETGDGMSLLGISLERQGRYDEALTHFRRAASKSPNIVEPRLGVARMLLKLGRVDDAVAMYRAVVRDFPEVPAAHHGFGTALLKSDRIEEALQEFDRALQLDPAFPQAQAFRGKALLALGRLVQAQAAFEQALEEDPNSSATLFQLGEARRRQGQLAEALGCFQKASEIDPDQPVLLNALGYTWEALGDWPRAMLGYKLAIATDPGFSDAHFNLANLMAACADHAGAVAHLREFSRLAPNSPNSPQADFRLGWLLATSADDQVRDGEQAVIVARRFCEAATSERGRCLGLTAAARAANGDFTDATDLATQALEAVRTGQERGLEQRLLDHLEFYRNSRPFRESTTPDPRCAPTESQVPGQPD